jgi:MFS family permease
MFDFANIGGYAVGFFLGGVLHEAFRYDLGHSFFVTAAIMAMAALVSLALLREPPHIVNKKASLNPFKAIDAQTRSFLPLWLGVTILLGVVFYLPNPLRRLGVGALSTGNLLSAAVVFLGVGSVGFGALSDRVGRQKVMLLGVVGLLGLLTSLALLSGDPFFRGSIVRYWYILGPLALAATALVPAILALLGDKSIQNSRGFAMGLYSMMLSFGLAIGNVVGGVADAAGGLRGILTYGASIFLAACLVSLSLIVILRSKAPTGEVAAEGPTSERAA